jgi:hypothetical protein
MSREQRPLGKRAKLRQTGRAKSLLLAWQKGRSWRGRPALGALTADKHYTIHRRERRATQSGLGGGGGSRVRTRLRRSFPVSWERTGTFAEKAGTVPTLCPQFASHLRRLSSEFPRSRIRECGRQEHGPEHQEQGVRQHASGVPSASSYGADHVAPPPAVSSRERRNSPAGLQ